MEAAQDRMGRNNEKNVCVPLTTLGAAKQAEKPREDHFKLGIPLSTAALPHPCVTSLT